MQPSQFIALRDGNNWQCVLWKVYLQSWCVAWLRTKDSPVSFLSPCAVHPSTEPVFKTRQAR